MWERFGRRSTKGSSRAAALPFGAALGRVRGQSGRQGGSRQARTPFGGAAVGLGVGAVAIAATIALLLLLRRRKAARQGSSTEEVHEEANEAASTE